MTISGYFAPGMSYGSWKTPMTALKAFEGGFVPSETYILRSGAVKSINEEPWDIEEIERVLAKADLELGTQVILMDMFMKMIHSEDQELALFAAESVNAIENRYLERIRILREMPDRDAARKTLARQYYELGILNSGRKSLREFYLRECADEYESRPPENLLDGEELNILVRALIELGELDKARACLDALPACGVSFLKFLEAEVEFAAGNISGAYRAIASLSDCESELGEREREMYRFWTKGE